jgi:hypothetical protein
LNDHAKDLNQLEILQARKKEWAEKYALKLKFDAQAEGLLLETPGSSPWIFTEPSVLQQDNQKEKTKSIEKTEMTKEDEIDHGIHKSSWLRDVQRPETMRRLSISVDSPFATLDHLPMPIVPTEDESSKNTKSNTYSTRNVDFMLQIWQKAEGVDLDSITSEDVQLIQKKKRDAAAKAEMLAHQRLKAMALEENEIITKLIERKSIALGLSVSKKEERNSIDTRATLHQGKLMVDEKHKIDSGAGRLPTKNVSFTQSKERVDEEKKTSEPLAAGATLLRDRKSMFMRSATTPDFKAEKSEVSSTASKRRLSIPFKTEEDEEQSLAPQDFPMKLTSIVSESQMLSQSLSVPTKQSDSFASADLSKSFARRSLMGGTPHMLQLGKSPGIPFGKHSTENAPPAQLRSRASSPVTIKHNQLSQATLKVLKKLTELDDCQDPDDLKSRSASEAHEIIQRVLLGPETEPIESYSLSNKIFKKPHNETRAKVVYTPGAWSHLVSSSFGENGEIILKNRDLNRNPQEQRFKLIIDQLREDANEDDQYLADSNLALMSSDDSLIQILQEASESESEDEEPAAQAQTPVQRRLTQFGKRLSLYSRVII